MHKIKNLRAPSPVGNETATLQFLTVPVYVICKSANEFKRKAKAKPAPMTPAKLQNFLLEGKTMNVK